MTGCTTGSSWARGASTAAATLAKEGVKVLLLERHNIPGGCAPSFCRGRFEFETALHQLSGVGSKDRPGPLRPVLEALEVFDKVEFIVTDELYRTVYTLGHQTTPNLRLRLGDVTQATLAPVGRQARWIS